MFVLYDASCGFCRWAMAWAVRHDQGRLLVAVPIQSPLGGELLAGMVSGERLRSAHVVSEDGRRRSAGAAGAQVLSALAHTRALGRLASRFPRGTELVYRVVAARRHSFGRLVGAEARRRADELLAAQSVSSAAELELRSRPRG
jgi:predicted DCC family thiol-disulfide oxidoreductase YuxK